jgi:hypothetical protein
MRVDTIVEQGQQYLDQATNLLKGGALPGLSHPVAVCMKVGVKSYMQLDSKHRDHIDSLVANTLYFVQSLKPQYPKIVEYVSNLNVDNVTGLIKMAIKLLRKKNTAKIIQQYLDVYADLMHNPKRMKAIGAYMVCILSNLESKYKQAVISAIELLFTFVAVVSHTDLANKVALMSDSVKKHIIRPMYKELARKK